MHKYNYKKRKDLYSKKDITYISSHYGVIKVTEMAKKLETTVTGLRNFIHRQGFKKVVPPESKLQEMGYKIRYSIYERAAKKRKLSFRLTFKQFCDISIQDCYYCGDKAPLINPFHTYRNGTAYHHFKKDFKLKCIGIDRKVNTAGYTIKNCVPCCFDCNSMKMHRNSNNFLAKVAKIYYNLLSEKKQ
jgi:hypothetical protein